MPSSENEIADLKRRVEWLEAELAKAKQFALGNSKLLREALRMQADQTDEIQQRVVNIEFSVFPNLESNLGQVKDIIRPDPTRHGGALDRRPNTEEPPPGDNR